MITTRGKDNISDVGRQKCVIIILVYAYFQFDWKRRMSYLPMFCATSSLNALCKQMRTEETSCSFEYKIVWELCLFLMLPGSLKTFPVLSVSTACHCDVMWFSNSWILWNQKCIPMQSFYMWTPFSFSLLLRDSTQLVCTFRSNHLPI